MAFADILGNQLLKKRLFNIIESGNIPQCIIFEGPMEIAFKLAESFAQSILCTARQNGDACGFCRSCNKILRGNSEELIYFGKSDEKAIKVDEIRSMGDIAMSYKNHHTFLLVRNIFPMKGEAQAAMLKLLEEPPKNIHILLVTENADWLFDTIRSRCQLFKVENNGLNIPIEYIDSDIFKNNINLLCNIVKNRPFFELKNDIEYLVDEKSLLWDFLDVAELFFRDILLIYFEIPENNLSGILPSSLLSEISPKCDGNIAIYGIKAVEKARRDLDSNVSPGHTLKYMIFDIQERISQFN